MTRVLAIRCPDCGWKFAGDEAMARHRFLAGDRYRCRSRWELLARNYWQDDAGIWHRGASLRLPFSTDSDSTQVSRVENTEARLLARSTDPVTSQLAAARVSYKTGSAKALLLGAYREEPSGLTDEEAAARVGMDLYQATKRCSDLRRDGAISPIGVRKGRAGLDRQVCAVAQEATA
jgi:hypothetical protein